METQLLTNNLYGLAITVGLLGMRHGFDADHLAAIDGLTRFNAGQRASLARNAGTLFSLGHGVVVISTALLVAIAARTWQVPAWIESIGAWSSIAVLLVLALANVSAVLRTPVGMPIALRGWRARWMLRYLSAGSALTIAAVGALFAVSFDTLSLAALFGMTATHFGRWPYALLLAGVFVVGMLITDGLNGVWIAHLIRRSERTALAASRIMALAIGGVSLVVAGVGIAVQLLPAASPVLATRGVWISVALVVVIVASFVLGLRAARRTPPMRLYSQSEEC
ncbi:MAG: nickel transporter [Pseudomonadota bacterium]|nr:nickel transporter [Pseudomonadota bacterium]